MSLFTRRRTWTTSLLIVLVMMICIMGVLVNVQGAEAKSLSPRTSQSYYVESFHEIADGTPYTLDAREYPTFQGDSANSTMTIPQVDAYDSSGHFEWNMWGQFAENNINGVNYASIQFYTNGPQAPGNLIETVRWYPPIPHGFAPGCTLEGPIFEAPSGDATAPASCNGAFDQILYDPLEGKLDHSFVGSPDETAFVRSLEQQRGAIDNIINHPGLASTGVPLSYLPLGVGLLIAGLALQIAGHVMQNTLSNKKWAKIVGGIMADIGGGVFFGGAVIVGAIASPFITAAIEESVVASETADSIASIPSESEAAIQAAEHAFEQSSQIELVGSPS